MFCIVNITLKNSESDLVNISSKNYESETIFEKKDKTCLKKRRSRWP